MYHRTSSTRPCRARKRAHTTVRLISLTYSYIIRSCTKNWISFSCMRLFIFNNSVFHACALKKSYVYFVSIRGAWIAAECTWIRCSAVESRYVTGFRPDWFRRPMSFQVAKPHRFPGLRPEAAFCNFCAHAMNCSNCLCCIAACLLLLAAGSAFGHWQHAY